MTEQIQTSHPNGHFYSPVVDPAELNGREQTLWDPDQKILGVDFRDQSHVEILTKVFPKYIPDYDYPEVLPETAQLTDFFTQNSQFSWLDSRTLFVLLRHWAPKRLIEVGSGFSSLLVADVNRRYFDSNMQVSCIEPFPREFLEQGIDGLSEVIVQKVQDVNLALFEQLDDGDILFIDSSHVCKTGSDVNHLYFEVLPRLKPGVIVHIHDIHLPLEYLREWVIDENRSWNEQYLLRALLMHSTAFEVVFGCNYAVIKHPELVKQALALPSGAAFGGGSFWIRKLSA